VLPPPSGPGKPDEPRAEEKQRCGFGHILPIAAGIRDDQELEVGGLAGGTRSRKRRSARNQLELNEQLTLPILD
jgi:hypothetical protein